MSNKIDIKSNELIKRIEMARSKVSKRERVLIGVAGPPAAGKSTFASNLVDRLNSLLGMSAAQVVSIDGFHKRQKELANLGLLDRKGTPETYDVAILTEKMKEIRFGRGRVSKAPGYSREIHDVVDEAVVIPGEVEIVVLEGNYLLIDNDNWRALYELLDEVWYLEVDKDIVRHRLIDRHLGGGRTEEQAIWKTDLVDLKNYELIEQTKYRADLILRQ